MLFRSAEVLILDEPTAVLTPQEVEDFFGIVKSLRDAGKAIVFITHKLHEILEISDRINVLRGGRITGEGDPKSLTENQLAEMMVGRPVSFDVDKGPFKPGETLLDVKNLTVLNENDETAVENVSFHVRSGEVVGIAGVQGNGQSELIEALTGAGARRQRQGRLSRPRHHQCQRARKTPHGHGAYPRGPPQIRHDLQFHDLREHGPQHIL